jgi:hypothetical protein
VLDLPLCVFTIFNNDKIQPVADAVAVAVVVVFVVVVVDLVVVLLFILVND